MVWLIFIYFVVRRWDCMVWACGVVGSFSHRLYELWLRLGGLGERGRIYKDGLASVMAI